MNHRIRGIQLYDNRIYNYGGSLNSYKDVYIDIATDSDEVTVLFIYRVYMWKNKGHNNGNGQNGRNNGKLGRNKGKKEQDETKAWMEQLETEETRESRESRPVAKREQYKKKRSY